MANLTLLPAPHTVPTTLPSIEIEQSVLQQTKPAAVDITGGQAIRENASGMWVLADATSAGNSTGVYIASRTVRAGDGLTAIRLGEMFGWDLSALVPNQAVYLSDTPGALADSAGTVSVVLGRVTSGWAVSMGSAPSLLLRVMCPA